VNEYVLNYAAWKVQNPTQRPGTALALVGSSGTGKSTFEDMMGDLFGAAHSPSSAGGDDTLF
jgi:ABC-type glutathione transport system ATPase component